MRDLAGAAGVSLHGATIVALCHDHFRVAFETRDCAPKTDSRLPDFAGVNAFGRFPRIGGPRSTKELQEVPGLTGMALRTLATTWYLPETENPNKDTQKV